VTVTGVQSRQYYIVIEDEALLAMARVPRPRVRHLSEVPYYTVHSHWKQWYLEPAVLDHGNRPIYL
jgi:hypothetical protein